MRITFTSLNTFGLGLLFLSSTTACGVTKLDGDAGGTEALPPEVQAVFDDSCALSGCHADVVQPILSAPASLNIIDGRLIVAGDASSSVVVQRMQGMGSIMPPSGALPDADVAIIVDWVNDGAELVITDAMDDGVAMDGTTGDMDTGGMDTGDMDTGGMDTGGDMQLWETYDDIQAVFDASCALAGCHVEEPNAPAPDLSEGVSYDNIVDVTGDRGTYITPEDLENSYLYQRMTGSPTFMPPGAEAEVEGTNIIEQWILQGAGDVAPDGGGDDGAGEDPTFDGDIQSFLIGTCATSASCHETGGVLPPLDGDYDDILNASTGAGDFVVPNDPESSRFYIRMTDDTEGGGLMPLGGNPLPADEAEDLVRPWIEAGAPE